MCISGKFPGDADASGLGAAVKTPLYNSLIKVQKEANHHSHIDRHNEFYEY